MIFLVDNYKMGWGKILKIRQNKVDKISSFKVRELKSKIRQNMGKIAFKPNLKYLYLYLILCLLIKNY